jgi:hypothetical protein
VLDDGVGRSIEAESPASVSRTKRPNSRAEKVCACCVVEEISKQHLSGTKRRVLLPHNCGGANQHPATEKQRSDESGRKRSLPAVDAAPNRQHNSRKDQVPSTASNRHKSATQANEATNRHNPHLQSLDFSRVAQESNPRKTWS